METAKEKLERCFRSIRAKTDFKPVTAIVLGSGLGDYADSMDVKQVVDYKDIEGFPVSTAPGHKGRFVMGYVGKVPVIAMQGRFHYYEGYDMKDVVLPIRIMHMLGAKRLILTNASGGIRRDLKPGDIMMITDQISSLVPSPLRGINFDKLGPRFPDMSEIYDKSFREKARKCALKLGIELKEGIYIQTQGPNYESPAEIRAYEKMGADAVGMSTTVEAIAANHMGMKILGLSCISNLAAGISENPLTEEEVIVAGKKVASSLGRLVTAIISEE